MTNKTMTTLYIGVTNDLFGRVRQHKDKINKGFTSKYNLDRLVYYEEFEYVKEAIAREKQLKAGSRKRKEDLIGDVERVKQKVKDFCFRAEEIKRVQHPLLEKIILVGMI